LLVLRAQRRSPSATLLLRAVVAAVVAVPWLEAEVARVAIKLHL
jgi:hypothetical protein